MDDIEEVICKTRKGYSHIVNQALAIQKKGRKRLLQPTWQEFSSKEEKKKKILKKLDESNK